MEVTSIVDIGSRGGWTLEQGRTYSIDLKVETDDPKVGSSTVLAALNLFTATTYRYPWMATAVETDERCFLHGVDIQRTAQADNKQWLVTLEFSPWNSTQDPRGPVDENGNRNPFDATPVLRCRGDAIEQGVPYDRNGLAILNSANDPFEDAPVIEEPLVVFEISRWERFFDPAVVIAVQGHINDDEWMGFAAGSILCRSIASVITWNQDIQDWAWQCEYSFAFKPSLVSLTASGIKVRAGWQYRTYDRGFRRLDGENKITIVDKYGVALDSPSNLDGSGGVLPFGDPPVQLTYDIWPTADFSALGFPPDLFTRASAEPEV